MHGQSTERGKVPLTYRQLHQSIGASEVSARNHRAMNHSKSSRSPIPHREGHHENQYHGSLSRSKSPVETLPSRNTASHFTANSRATGSVQLKYATKSFGELMSANIGEKWHTLLNRLENHFRSRIIDLRTKLGEILERGGTED